MDYKNNQRFFDKKFNKTTSMIFTIGAILAGAGGAGAVLSMLMGRGSYIIRSVSWPVLIVGVAILCVAFSRMVKESEITGAGDVLIKALKEKCDEKLEYPNDLEDRSLVFVGCHLTDDNIDEARKLKSGNYISTELVISFFYEKKGSLYIAQRTVSFIKEGYTDVEKTLSFNDFDSVGVEVDTLKNGAKINFVRFYKDGKMFFETPLVDNDYYKEEYFKSIMHDKERLAKQQ